MLWADTVLTRCAEQLLGRSQKACHNSVSESALVYAMAEACLIQAMYIVNQGRPGGLGELLSPELNRLDIGFVALISSRADRGLDPGTTRVSCACFFMRGM